MLMLLSFQRLGCQKIMKGFFSSIASILYIFRMKLMKKNVYLNFKVESNIYTKEVLYRISKNTVNLGLLKSRMFVHSIVRPMNNLCSPKKIGRRKYVYQFDMY